MEVVRLALTPVKSTGMLLPSAIDLRTEGAVGDRRFLFVRDDGTRPSGISKAPLIPLQGNWDQARERLSITFPDGTVVDGDAVGRGDPVQVRLFDREVAVQAVDPDLDDAIRRLVDGTLHLGRVVEPEYAGGSHRVSIVSTASIEDLAERTGDPNFDPRRLRMLLQIEGCAAYEEDAWRGKLLRAGEATIRVGGPMPRCVMTTLDAETGERNAPTLSVLSRYRQHEGKPVLGVYGDVELPGHVALGDPVRLLEG